MSHYTGYDLKSATDFWSAADLSHNLQVVNTYKYCYSVGQTLQPVQRALVVTGVL